jgi:arylsulfatase A-like enzyme
MSGYDSSAADSKLYPRQPTQAGSMAEVRRMFDGYDTAVRYVDEQIGRIVAALAELNILDQTAIVISSDHGENLGELNIYGDHQTADYCTCRVPMIVRWPGLGARVDGALHYHFDVAATLIELAGGKPPAGWDGKSFAQALRAGKNDGRPYLILSQGSWTCQRAIRFDEYLCIRTWHDGHHGFADLMVFNVVNDPAEQHDLAARRPDLGVMALAMLDQWQGEMMRKSRGGIDPMWGILSEGGPFYTRGKLEAYLERLRKTGRGDWAAKLGGKAPA